MAFRSHRHSAVNSHRRAIFSDSDGFHFTRGLGNLHLTMLIIHKRLGILFIQKYQHEPYRTRIRPWDAKPLNYLIQNLALTGFEFFLCGVRWKIVCREFAEVSASQILSIYAFQYKKMVGIVWQSKKKSIASLRTVNFVSYLSKRVQKLKQIWILDNFKCQASSTSVWLPKILVKEQYFFANIFPTNNFDKSSKTHRNSVKGNWLWINQPWNQHLEHIEVYQVSAINQFPNIQKIILISSLVSRSSDHLVISEPSLLTTSMFPPKLQCLKSVLNI